MTFCFHRIIVFVSVLALSCGVAHRASAQCPGDCYDDGLGVVNGGDLAMVLGNWGVSGSSSADLTEDGLVDGRDLSIVLGAWGPCSPVLSAVSPLGGSPTGGMLITLSGKYLFGATEVMVGGTPATNVRVVNDSTVTAVAPAGPLGATSVLVTTPRGSASLLDAFTYVTVPAWATLLEATPDPAVVWDADLRAAITATGLAWRVKDSATQIEMVLIPSGQFSMGCSPAAPYGCGNDEYPIHSVGISVARYLGRFEVTQSQWQLVMGENPSIFQNASEQVPLSQVFRRPVEQVSWTMIMEPDGFAARTGMRLPTEAEWEYAYRAGGLSAYHGFPANPNSTDDALRAGRIAWSASNSDDQTHPVGELGGNGFGLHDMSGNVSEWVVDNYAADYYSQSPLLDPPGPRESHVRCLRGGSWWSTSWHIRASRRGSSYPYARDSTTGFRVARDP